MAKIKYDYTDVDESQSQYDGDEPTRGIYPAQVTEVLQEQSSKTGNPMLHVKFKITEGDFKGWIGHDYYVLTEEAAWKLKQFTDAVGLTLPGKKKGTLDTDDAVNKRCRIKVVREMYEGEPRGKVRSVLSFKSDEDTDAEADEAPAEDEAAEETPEETPEPEAAADDVWTWDDLKDMDRAQLKQTIVEEELKEKVKVLRSDTDDQLRIKLAEALEVEVPEEGDEGGEEEPF